jgi:hypothetical protein
MYCSFKKIQLLDSWARRIQTIRSILIMYSYIRQILPGVFPFQALGLNFYIHFSFSHMGCTVHLSHPSWFNYATVSDNFLSTLTNTCNKIICNPKLKRWICPQLRKQVLLEEYKDVSARVTKLDIWWPRPFSHYRRSSLIAYNKLV